MEPASLVTRDFSSLEKRSKGVRAPHQDPLTGFTLIEMMVVLAIITIVTSIALFGQQDFNRSMLLTNTAYTVALSSREAQALGLSSRRYQAGATDIQNAGYGVAFSSATPTQYVLFADTQNVATPLATCPRGKSGTPEAKPGNCVYDAGQDGLVQTYTFNRGFTIADFCATRADTGVELCSSTGALSGLYVLSIRPNTETVLTMQRSNNSYVAASKAAVYLQSQDGTARRGICYTLVGQVSVVQSTCP